MAFKVGIIGCGGRGHEQAQGYGTTSKAQIVAVADPVLESAQKLAKQYGAENIHGDYREMLSQNKLDMVSICTWPEQHYDQVMAAIQAGVRAIHCEKPMAPTYGEALKMHQAATEAGIQLTFCHQRRFRSHFNKMRTMIQQGEIGKLRRLEGRCSNLFDWGTHWFDMFFFLNNETPAQWVMGQFDITNVRSVFGVPVDTQGMSLIEYENGVRGYMETGKGTTDDFWVRAEGSDGILEARHPDSNEFHLLKYGRDWEVVTAEPVNVDQENSSNSTYSDATVLSVLEAIECLESGRESLLSTHNALRATELIFATYESSRRRGRVNLPLDITDSPLIDAVEQLKAVEQQKSAK
jgi:predicted dehydrogenase